MSGIATVSSSLIIQQTEDRWEIPNVAPEDQSTLDEFRDGLLPGVSMWIANFLPILIWLSLYGSWAAVLYYLIVSTLVSALVGCAFSDDHCRGGETFLLFLLIFSP
jgi:hypothetical protein